MKTHYGFMHAVTITINSEIAIRNYTQNSYRTNTSKSCKKCSTHEKCLGSLSNRKSRNGNAKILKHTHSLATNQH